MPRRGCAPWDQIEAWEPDDVRLPSLNPGDYRQWDKNYKTHNICRHPDCTAWIKDGAKTCKPHRYWYEQWIKEPAKRLVQIARRIQAEKRDDLMICPAIVLGKSNDGYEIGVISYTLEGFKEK